MWGEQNWMPFYIYLIELPLVTKYVIRKRIAKAGIYLELCPKTPFEVGFVCGTIEIGVYFRFYVYFFKD